jgi:hypothetical protein
MHKDIFLATGVITEATLFQNGLHQNSLLLYDLFERLGYHCHCLVDVSCEFIQSYRYLQPEDYLRQEDAYRVVFYIEIGLSLDSAWRAYLQKKGCKTAKLYLGNVLNIDTETVCMTPGLFFHHHNTGHFDYIWTSPHYKANCAWLTALHDVPCSVVPYIWSPKFLTSLSPQGTSFKPSGDIIIAEPNISFQKTALVPLLLAEAYYRVHPGWKGHIYIQNSERLLVTPFWNRIVESLSLYLDGRIVFSGRKSILELIQEHEGAVFICHQLTNEYNYMILELLYLGIPVLHTSECWSNSGHYYSVDHWTDAVQTLEEIIEGKWDNHHNLDILWMVSPENPVIQEDWAKLLA